MPSAFFDIRRSIRASPGGILLDLFAHLGRVTSGWVDCRPALDCCCSIAMAAHGGICIRQFDEYPFSSIARIFLQLDRTLIVVHGLRITLHGGECPAAQIA